MSRRSNVQSSMFLEVARVETGNFLHLALQTFLSLLLLLPGSEAKTVFTVLGRVGIATIFPVTAQKSETTLEVMPKRLQAG